MQQRVAQRLDRHGGQRLFMDQIVRKPCLPAPEKPDHVVWPPTRMADKAPAVPGKTGHFVRQVGRIGSQNGGNLTGQVGRHLASGGKATSNNIGRYLNASNPSGHSLSKGGQTVSSALTELKESYGSLASFIKLKDDIFETSALSENGDTPSTFSFAIKLKQDSHFVKSK